MAETRCWWWCNCSCSSFSFLYCLGSYLSTIIGPPPHWFGVVSLMKQKRGKTNKTKKKKRGKVDVTLSVRKWRCIESSNRAEWSFSPFSDAISLCISPSSFFLGGEWRLARQEVGTERIGKMPTIDAAAWE